MIMGYDYYDDPNFSYPAFWSEREYEHQAECMALERLLEGHRFSQAADIGGGFGRLSDTLLRYAKKLIIVEPSPVQRTLAAHFVSREVEVRAGDSVSTGIPGESCDLVVMIRVIHHLTDPEPSLRELGRILVPGGYLILEFANSYNLKSRIRHFFKGESVTEAPITVGSNEEVPFVNHHPRTMLRLLEQEGFLIVRTYSVSNLRSPFLKRLVPTSALLKLEHVLQPLLARRYFGPSLFVLARRPLIEKGPRRPLA